MIKLNKLKKGHVYKINNSPFITNKNNQYAEYYSTFINFLGKRKYFMLYIDELGHLEIGVFNNEQIGELIPNFNLFDGDLNIRHEKFKKGQKYKVDNNTFMSKDNEFAEYHSTLLNRAGQPLHRMIYTDLNKDLSIDYMFDDQIHN